MTQTYPVFPARLAHGVSGGPEHDVEIITLASGHERRNRRRRAPLRRYVLPGAARPVAEARALMRFFEARGGPSEAFLFRDPFFNATDQDGVVSATDVVLGTGDGVTGQFAARADGAKGIVYPRSATLLAAIDGQPVTPGSGVWLAANGHDLVFAAPPANGATVTAGFSFHVLVRFENAQLSLTQVAHDAVRHDDIILREVLA